jgi:hypothetical protein
LSVRPTTQPIASLSKGAAMMVAHFLREHRDVRMQAIESKAISAVGYDPARQVLRVTFRGGKSYEYLDVSPEDYDDFMDADSRGTYMNQVIKNKYEWREV